jgi:hypothetical protein
MALFFYAHNKYTRMQKCCTARLLFGKTVGIMYTHREVHKKGARNMKAISSVSGGVIFIPDEGETQSLSYRDLLKEEQGNKQPVFGKRTTNTTEDKNVKNVA